jgi:hypothetical protein
MVVEEMCRSFSEAELTRNLLAGAQGEYGG